MTLETAPILTPITYDDYDMFKALVKADADVNCSDRVGFTMLMTIVCDNEDGTEVISESRLSCLKLALKTGAHVNKVNLYNDTALEICIDYGSMKYRKYLAELLFAAGEKVRDEKPKSKILRKIMAKEDNLALMAICRKSIRKHLLDLDPHLNLFHRVPKLEVPHTIVDFMLFDWTLDADEDESIDGTNNDEVMDGNEEEDDDDDNDDDDDDDDNDDDDDDDEQEKEEEEGEEEEDQKEEVVVGEEEVDREEDEEEDSGNNSNDDEDSDDNDNNNDSVQ